MAACVLALNGWSFSNLLPQLRQKYSYIGMAFIPSLGLG